MGSIRKRGEVYYIRYSRGGKKFEESSHSAKRADAAMLLRLREGDTAKGVPINPRIGRILFDEAMQMVINDYITNRKRSLELLKARIRKHLKPFFGGRRLASMGTAHIKEYTSQRLAEGAQAATVNRELAIIKRGYTLAMQDGTVITRPHIPMLREAPPRAGFLTDKQLEQVIHHLPADVRPAIEFAGITGWRIPSEVLALRWKNVDFDGGRVRLEPGTTKSGRPRVFPFTTELRELLEGQRKRVTEIEHYLARRIPYVFIWTDSMRRRLPGTPIRSFRKSWQSACRSAGVPGRVPHDMRRSAVKVMIERGVPERVAMDLVGMRTRSILDRYHIVANADLVNAAARLSKGHSKSLPTGVDQGGQLVGSKKGRS
jgi:integrase